MSHSKNNQPRWKTKLYTIIYEADTPAGKLFDIILLIAILMSILLVMLESVDFINDKYNSLLNSAEWVITILFSLEYIVRLLTVKKPLNYALSFYGIIDFLSTIPKYLSLILVGTHSLTVLRGLRLLRVFRILKLTRFIGESTNFTRALLASRVRIIVFLSYVIIICIILGTVMYLVEGQEDSGFTSIPKSVYWAIVTMTTVGYGDIAPVTALGQFIASVIMILGYGIIAIPTGIVTSEMTKKQDNTNEKIHTNTQTCSNCLADIHRDNANYCYECGHKFNE